MVMSMRPVHMAVGDFFFRGGAHFQDVRTKAQGLAGQGVVGVQDDFVALDFDDGKGACLAIGIAAFQLAAYFDTGRKLGFGDGLQQRFVALAKGIRHRQIQSHAVTRLLAQQRFFHFGEDIAVAAMQVGDGLFALLKDFASRGSDLVMEGDGAVLADFHGGKKYFEGLKQSPLSEKPCALPRCGAAARPATRKSEIIRPNLQLLPQRIFPMSDSQQRIDSLVKGNDVVLFMKGNANFPQCGFSGKAIQILKASGVDTKALTTVNVLEDEGIRQGIKEYSNWPTIPQLYIKGEFIGGSDIMMEMYESGELLQALGNS